MKRSELYEARDVAALKCIDLFREVKQAGLFMKQPLLELQLLAQVHGVMCRQLESERDEFINSAFTDPIDNALCELKTALRDNPHHKAFLEPIILRLGEFFGKGGAA